MVEPQVLFAPLLHIDRIQGLWNANPLALALLSRNVWTHENNQPRTLQGVGVGDLIPRVQMLRACTAYVTAKLHQNQMAVAADRIQLGVALELGACMMPEAAALTADAEGVRALRGQIAIFLNAEAGRADPIEQWFGLDRNALYGAGENQIAIPAENASFAAHINFLISLGLRMRPALVPSLYQILAIIIVGYGKRGQVTPVFINKINRELSEATNREIQITRDQAAQFYLVVAPHINPGNAALISARLQLLTQNEPVVLRLNLIAQRMSGSGLMAYVTIGRAIRAFNDFPWNRVAAILPAEWANYRQAIGTVGGNMFYGFSADLGDARSTRFKTLAYISTRLFQICYGQAAAAAYAGFAHGVRHQAFFQNMVQNYQAGRGAVLDGILGGEEAQQVVDLVHDPAHNAIFAVDMQ